MKEPKPTKEQVAMRKLGSFGGRATVKKFGKSYMKNLSSDYWKKKKAERRSKLKTK